MNLDARTPKKGEEEEEEEGEEDMDIKTDEEEEVSTFTFSFSWRKKIHYEKGKRIYYTESHLS